MKHGGLLGLALAASIAAASNGQKPPAQDSRSLGRAGAGLAHPGSALSMHTNPALAARVWDEAIDVMPTLQGLDIEYKDPQNDTIHSDEDSLGAINFGFVFDSERTRGESSGEGIFQEREDREFFQPRPPGPDSIYSKAPTQGYSKILHRSIVRSGGEFPKTIEVQAAGANAEVYNIAIVANYPGTPLQPHLAHSSIVATSAARHRLNSAEWRTVSRFENVANPQPRPPKELVVYYMVESYFTSDSDSVSVRVLFDGAQIGGDGVTWSDVKTEIRPPELPPEPEPVWRHDALERPKTIYSAWKYGLGLSTESNLHTDWTLMSNGGTLRRWSSESVVHSITGTVAYHPDDRWAVGASLLINHETFELRQPIRNPATPALDDLIEVRDADAWSVGLRAGLYWAISGRVTFGATLGWPQLFQSDLEGDGRFTDTAGVSGPYDATVEDFQLPPEVAAGIAWRAAERFHLLTDWNELYLLLDIRRIFWSAALDEVDVKFTGGSTGGLPASVTRTVPFDWDDQTIFMLGAEATHRDWLHVRAGASFSSSWIPDDTLQPNFPFVTELHGAIGFTISASDSLKIDFAYAHGFGNSQKTGSVSKVSADLNGGKITAFEDLFTLTVVYEY